MDWSKVKRKTVKTDKPEGVYTNLEELIRIRFKVGDFSLQPRQPVTSVLSGRYASRLRGRGLNFEELRRYHPGDDTRTMDWKVTARTRSPHVRVYTEEKDRVVLLIVDQRSNMFFGTKNRLKSVTAAELAALAAWRAIDSGDRVGAIVFNDTELVEIRPQRSQEAVMSILGAVVHMNHQLSADSTRESNEKMINRALQKARALAGHDVLVVLVSDYFGVDEESERLVTEMGAHNDVIAFLVHDPMRMQPVPHKLALSDGSLQMEIDFKDNRTREKLVTDFRAEQEKITYFLRKLSAPLLMVSNSGDVSDQVRKLLGVPVRQ
ncbi:MAG: DUF58 domain-containing protein [Thermodesulfobacteriota bacterium]